jgi:3',5'-cyclic AMP phosphodiesterase CpdA
MSPLSPAIIALINSLWDDNSTVRCNAAEALGNKDCHEEIIFALIIKCLNDEEYTVRLAAVETLEKLGNDNKYAVSALIIVTDKEKEKSPLVRSKAVQALGKVKEPLTNVEENLNLKYIRTVLKPILKNIPKELQHACDFNSKEEKPMINYNLNSTIHILHLSDLHFGTPDQAKLWSNQLASDLQNELNIPHLDALILSGDIANKSTPTEYEAAQQFLQNFRQDFTLKPEQIIIVPGNHDIDWKKTDWKKTDWKTTDEIQAKDVAYILKDKHNCTKEELEEGRYILVSEDVVRVRDEKKYKQRFEHFCNFYQTIKTKPYPLDYDQQYTLDHFPDQNLLVLGLNSAWHLDHHYKSRASINITALTNALTEIRRNQDYKDFIKIAVWHHPLNSGFEDRIIDHGFMEQLAQANFRFAVHGHIHKAETSLYKYDMSASGRKLDIICAGTFGAPVRKWVPGYPLQYNLLKIAENKLTVYTRRREELNGAWKPDARWQMGAGQNPLPYYEISL